MRILYVTAHYPPDFVSGATLQVRRLAEAVASRGHDVAVLSGAIRDPGLADGSVRTERLQGVTVHWIGTASRIEQDVDDNWRNPHATAAAGELIAAFRPDVVHGHALQTLGADMLALSAAQRIPTVVTMHDFWWWCSRLFLVDRDLQPCDGLRADSRCECARDTAWRRSRHTALHAVMADLDLVLVPSRTMADALAATAVVPVPLDVDENDLDVAVSGPAAAVGSTADVRFLYVGGDSPLKGHDVLIAAAGRLAERDGWRLDLRGATAPRRSRWRRSRPRPRLRYLPPYGVAEAAGVFADADVLVIPSIARESFSIAAREALRAGLAVITTDCLGPEEVVEDGRNGLVVPTGNPAALADAMRRLIEDRTLLWRLRAQAADDPVPVRTPDEHAAALIDRYETLRGRAPA